MRITIEGAPYGAATVRAWIVGRLGIAEPVEVARDVPGGMIHEMLLRPAEP